MENLGQAFDLFPASPSRNQSIQRNLTARNSAKSTNIMRTLDRKPTLKLKPAFSPKPAPRRTGLYRAEDSPISSPQPESPRNAGPLRIKAARR